MTILFSIFILGHFHPSCTVTSRTGYSCGVTLSSRSWTEWKLLGTIPILKTNVRYSPSPFEDIIAKTIYDEIQHDWQFGFVTARNVYGKRTFAGSGISAPISRTIFFAGIKELTPPEVSQIYFKLVAADSDERREIFLNIQDTFIACLEDKDRTRHGR